MLFLLLLLAEARTHGVGYFPFAKDESARRAQQDELRSLRKETEGQQKAALSQREKRKQLMRARLRAAHNRKRAREGLPPLAEGESTASTWRLAVDPVHVDSRASSPHQRCKTCCFCLMLRVWRCANPVFVMQTRSCPGRRPRRTSSPRSRPPSPGWSAPPRPGPDPRPACGCGTSARRESQVSGLTGLTFTQGCPSPCVRAAVHQLGTRGCGIFLERSSETSGGRDGVAWPPATEFTIIPN